ncbi:STAS domain-containing protein [Streptomyces chrestomyceticus]|uniref:STAS domain-containing protein n=1 Tax=Streptomyces chrestomyceticus TaxID=68185 RepID=UPI0019CF5E2A|nr:STAS domain-containing protein [Streptomyces chrestomyceticus]
MADPGTSLDFPRAGAVGTRVPPRHHTRHAPVRTSAPALPPEPATGEVPSVPVTDTDFAVLIVRGRVDLATLPTLRERLRRLPRAPGSLLIVDLSEVTDCCALALGPLVAAARRARAQGGDLRLVQPSPAVLAALQASGLNRLLPVFSGLDTATGTPAAEPPGPPAGAVA